MAGTTNPEVDTTTSAVAAKNDNANYVTTHDGEQQPETETQPKPKGGQKLINLLRGWPHPDLLPAPQLASAAAYVLADPEISVATLQYGIDPGYQPLREELARWLGELYKYEPAPENRGSGGGGASGIKADEIAISGGASQSLACVLQSFTDPAYTRAVWVVAPCYFMACPIFEDSGFRGRLRAVPEDEAGIDLEALERGLQAEAERARHAADHDHAYKAPYPDRKLYRHVIYLVATCANPSGKTLSLARREKLVRLAREHDALIISDDVYDFLQWPVTPAGAPPNPAALFSSEEPSSSPLPLGSPLPLLSQIDIALGPSPHDRTHSINHPCSGGSGSKHFGHAISNASFSKLVGPGVRTGWIHATADFAEGFAQTGTNRSGGAASQFAAAVIWRMLSTGELEAHVDRVVRPALRRRHALMVSVLEREVAGLGVRVWGGNGVAGAGTGTGVEATAGEEGGGGGGGEVFGGYFVWLTLPEGLVAAAVAERAMAEEQLVVAPGKLFEVSGDEGGARFPGNVRLSFSWVDEEDIVEGVARLGRVLRRMLAGEGSSLRGNGGGNAEEFK